MDSLGSPLDAGLRAAFDRGAAAAPAFADSLIDRLARRSGPRAGGGRLLLRGAPDERAPLARPGSSEIGDVALASGRYDVAGEIARGGVGAVFAARDRELGRDVAIKVLRREHAGNGSLVARFVEEAQIGSQLQHPGIVPIYEMGLLPPPDERPFLVMKLVTGRTLAATLEARARTSDDRRPLLDAFERLCWTIAYAHARGVVHRDLKPANVMLGAFGEVLVMDWGLAKVLAAGGVADERRAIQDASVATVRGGASLSRTGAVLGTPGNMPPEQARGEIERVDERADVFALGGILHEILTRRPLYEAETSDGLLAAAAAGDVRAARARLVACDADSALVRVALACLAPERDERPRDAGVVAREVSASLAAADARARAADVAAAAARARAHAERARRRLAVALAGAAVLLAALGAIGIVMLDRQASRARDAARVAEGALDLADSLARRAADVADWTEALGAARRGEAFAASAAACRERATAAVAAAERGLADARAVAARLDADHAMLARLEAVVTDAGDLVDPDPARLHASFLEAFAAYGIEVAGEAAEARIRASAIAVPLASALSTWSHVARDARLAGPPDAERLAALADAADPDPFRVAVRRASCAADEAELHRLAGAAEVDSLPIRTLDDLAFALDRAGDSAAAIALWRRAQSAAPDDYLVNLNLARSLVALDPPRPDEAARAIQATVAARPRSGLARLNLGIALLRAGDVERSVAACRDATRLLPGSAVAWSQLGRALEIAGDFGGSARAGEEATRVDPSYAGGWLVTSTARRLAGDVDGSAEALERAVAARPRDFALKTNLAAMRRMQGRDADAERLLLEVIAAEPNAHAWLNLGAIRSKRGDAAGAIDAFRAAIRIDPRHAEARCALGGALMERGELDAALVELKRGHELGSARPDWRQPSAEWIHDCEARIAERDGGGR